MHQKPRSPLNASVVDSLHHLLRPVAPDKFSKAIRHLQRQFSTYAATCPMPLPAPGLIVTPEIRRQSQLYLPIAEIGRVFNRLYCAALTYPPVLSSTPFYQAMSWTDCFAKLPPELQFSANPARLLTALLSDRELLARFLFASFLPPRFYGAAGRYPAQQEFIRKWLAGRDRAGLRCLDAACGIGEDTYILLNIISEAGYASDECSVEGWTLEPLEVWAATERRLPHDRHRELAWRMSTEAVLAGGYDRSITFTCLDLLAPDLDMARERFDLIICNGLLGGPIINKPQQLTRALTTLIALLKPGGLLLIADHFHGGWQQKYPQGELRALCERNGLQVCSAGEGFAGLKSDQQTTPG
jgi:chemotaxis methyl-accepting protein methylase